MRYLDDPRLERQKAEGSYADSDRPILILDGRYIPAGELEPGTRGEAAFIVTAKQPYVDRLPDLLDVKYLYLYEVRCADLSPVARIPNLRHLRIEWSTKLTSLKFLRDMPGLQTLRITDTRKVDDITPLESLKELKALEYCGAIWTLKPAKAHSLEPLAKLPMLEELRLRCVRVEEGGMRPLIHCPSLHELEVSNTFDTSDYALLSVAKPDLKCNLLQPWVRVPSVGVPWDTMVIGRRTPNLNSKTDGDEILKYERKFRALQEKHRRELGLSKPLS